jgi:hypothetical protein
MKNSTQQKTLWVLRFISMVLIIAFLFSDATVLSAAMPSIRNFVTETISKISFEKTSDKMTDESTTQPSSGIQTAGTTAEANTVSDNSPKPDTNPKREPIPVEIMSLLIRLYNYDNFTDKEKKA